MIWTQLYLTAIPLGLAVFIVLKWTPKNLDEWGVPILFFLLAAVIFSGYCFWSFRTLVFTDDAVEIRLGKLTLQRIPLEEVGFAVLFVQERPRGANVRSVVFAKRFYTVEEMHRASWKRKLGNHDIIFCQYDEDLIQTASAVFPTMFDPKNEYIHHYN